MSTTVRASVVDVHVVPVEDIHENPWNPNVQDARTYEAERESIRKYGFVDPITVRPHPTLAGELVAEGGDGWSETAWQAIDGAHRKRGAMDEGYDIVSINNLGEVPDEDAKKLTVILNEVSGDADISLLGKLLDDIYKSSGQEIEDLRNSLPYTSAELDHLLAIGAHDWDTFKTDNETAAREAEQAASNAQYTVFLSFDQGQREQYDTFTTMLVSEAGVDGYTVEEAVISVLKAACKTL